MLFFYKNVRNVRFVLFTKTSINKDKFLVNLRGLHVLCFPVDAYALLVFNDAISLLIPTRCLVIRSQLLPILNITLTSALTSASVQR